MAAFDEVFNGWCFTGVVEDEDYTELGPRAIHTEEQLGQFLVENVEKYSELRVVDAMDCLVLHVVRQRLIFPRPEESRVPPKWNPETRKFCPE